MFYYILASFILIPSLSFAQTTKDTINCNLTSKEIYSIIKFVIKKQKLDKDYGIDIIPYKSTDLNYSDTNYLQTLLIKPSYDTTTKTNSNKSIPLVSLINYPDKNILRQADIDYIICSQKTLLQFKWDNKYLGFNLTSKKYFYRFSIPFFNLTHDKIIIKYEFLCPGFCGTGKSILLTKKGNSWDITNLETWVH